MRNKHLAIALLASAAMIAACSLNALGGTPPEAMAGKVAPALKVSNWINTGGKTLTLSGLKGKVVVLDFWAYW